MAKGSIRHFLSPSTLDDFRKCPRCFWLKKVKKIEKPRGAFPSLPGGMDRIIKKYCDDYRILGKLPPQFLGRVKGLLYSDTENLKRMRFWKTSPLAFIDENLSVKVSGAIDELVVAGDGYSPLDYKTRGSALTEEKDPFEFYRNQLNTYALMLDASQMQINSRAYLTYWTPGEVVGTGEDLMTIVKFDVAVYEMAVDKSAAFQIIVDAVQCLEDTIPDPGIDPYTNGPCEVCTFVKKASMVAV